MTVNDVIEHCQSVIANLDKQLEQGKITQEEYDDRMKKQEAKTRECLREVMPSSGDHDILQLMKPR